MIAVESTDPRHTNAERAAALLAVIDYWYSQERYGITPAGRAVLAQHPSTGLPRDPRRGEPTSDAGRNVLTGPWKAFH
ncbi:hypothetical protein K1T35_47570 (plasmid) [Pseudonocardia sp. DSM 110487]|uniref:hypothetical protein n=1 Tax=Pseudonocardia sp. DSM 110487 TaxID=2865833 RepID=UPI001C6A6748|nr:hypothetical protein [Pseudonocardia sp. DSM 110487]QYN41010.1 hypothetical protein K1T35_47570 [Pseudonocardia sp. DSM 110487]